ncbi:MAG: hypothetical protein WBC30_02355, partial [Candidatus Sulfotelmatobacter sp.]
MFRDSTKRSANNAALCSDVEERRFSAASSFIDDPGFTPRDLICRSGIVLALLVLTAASPFSARAQKSAGAS